MNKNLVIVAAAAAAVAYYVYHSTDGGEATTQSAVLKPGAPLAEVQLPPDLSDTARIGKRAYDAICADCHGDNAAGRNGMGPPLVHKIYEPSHHGDAAFMLAVRNGVRAHHWNFGNMPAKHGLTDGDVKGITRYVRELQQANGIE
ncbi:MULTISPECIES: c-type cytochrome [unclassified Leisingera]|uniref:c-type cytochrome n=1 Tax=unclassified Leisingera TaxID=2614906 RepID=UPI001010F308|nr:MULTISPECIES: cytochrome c [unclassified Leisingera]MBQ4825670.1 cytochrome c [Leisingera sp. HS039]MCF6433420.1 cytochrome c [Leisingera sp. MMG026]QAX32399.1 cytochrome c [Leisingera sp. NJS204]QBR39016.1 cytochrome c [Leisingera sp. NJS201]